MKWNRHLLRIFLISTFFAVNALILFGISSVWSYLNTGADRSSRLHIGFTQEDSNLPTIDWDISSVEGRVIENQTVAEIERDYLKGWFVKNTALATNNRYGIDDYFTDSARVKLFKILKLNKENNYKIEQTTYEHHPKIDFYSTDGTQIAFTDTDVISYQKGYLNDQSIVEQKEVASYKVFMLLEDGFWRVRHFVKKTATPFKAPKPTTLKPKMKARLQQIKGLNYYPKDTPWDTFGKQFEDSIISADFKLIKAMSLNTIRIFIGYEKFGKTKVSEEKLIKLRTLLDHAQNNDLQVVITLFDFYGNYLISDWNLNHRHAERIVKTFKDHPALLAWDLKNEPDLDFESRGKENVLDWLKEMTLQIKQWDSIHPITVGWSSAEAAAHLTKELDFVSFHYYKKLKDFKQELNTLKKAVPDDKPIVLQEYGVSSYSGMWNAFTGSQEKQAAYYETMQSFLAEEDVPFLFWTLYDFESIPKSVVGILPWRKLPQKYYGCVDSNGDKKKAFEILAGTSKQ